MKTFRGRIPEGEGWSAVHLGNLLGENDKTYDVYHKECKTNGEYNGKYYFKVVLSKGLKAAKGNYWITVNIKTNKIIKGSDYVKMEEHNELLLNNLLELVESFADGVSE